MTLNKPVNTARSSRLDLLQAAGRLPVRWRREKANNAFGRDLLDSRASRISRHLCLGL
jgi:hypothetical protein